MTEMSEKDKIKALLGDEKISYYKTKRHIYDQHPIKVDPETHEEERFGVFDELGFLPIGKCCEKDIEEMAQQIGIGPTLFLLSTKALGYFFLFVTILSLPIIVFYANAGGST